MTVFVRLNVITFCRPPAACRPWIYPQDPMGSYVTAAEWFVYGPFPLTDAVMCINLIRKAKHVKQHSKCLRCSWNPMQWSKCLYCYSSIELWLRISSQAISVCFGGTPVIHSWNPEVPRNPGWKTLLYSKASFHRPHFCRFEFYFSAFAINKLKCS